MNVVSTPARHDAARALAVVINAHRAGALPRIVAAVEAHLNPAAVDVTAMDEATYTLYSTLAQLAPDEARPRHTMDEVRNNF